MVSIMRSDQTLRLIQLYHANYPDIARNNQDADGRNLKLHMWARIAEELNRTFGTAFTVEQFKKKVQNVQCTSRQKLFSGKRNLGEAEVEYLRLFESDKISEQTLAQRAKNRRSVSSAASTADFLREQRLKGEREGEEEDVEGEAGEEEDEQQEGGSGTEEGGTTGADGANSPSGDCNDAVAALSSLAALFSVAGECQQTQLATPLQPPQPQPQMDGAQQFLLAMLSASLNQMPTVVEAGRTAHGSGAERKRNATEEGGRREKEAEGTKRKRAEEKNGEEKEGTKRSRLEEKEGMKRMEEKEWEEKEKEGIKRNQMEEKEGEEKIKKAQNMPMMVVASAEGRQGEEHLWKTQMLQMQREVLEGQRQMVGPQLGPDDNHSPPAQLHPHQSHPPHQFLPASSPSSSSSSRPDHCCQMFGPKPSSACCCHSSELCARLDQTNAMLARIVQLITERLPPARDHPQE